MRPHLRQTSSLQDRIASFARNVREKTSQLPPGKEKDDMLRRARLADMASHPDDWANSPSLQPLK
jgi:leucyl aminopeptidase